MGRSFLKGGGFFSGLLHCCAVRNDGCDFAIPLRHCEAKLKQSRKGNTSPGGRSQSNPEKNMDCRAAIAARNDEGGAMTGAGGKAGCVSISRVSGEKRKREKNYKGEA